MTKQPQRATATLIARIKRAAKRRQREEGVPHYQTLEAEARAAGYASWHVLERSFGFPAADASSLPIDPILRDGFDATAHEQRSAQEIADWWDRPYLVTTSDGGYIVRCLDGGAWDRSTNYGRVETPEEGARLAARKLASWQQAMMVPLVSFDRNGRASVVRYPARPDKEMEVLFGPASPDEASAFLRRWNAENHPPQADNSARGVGCTLARSYEKADD